jgi:hypothetical protein
MIESLYFLRCGERKNKMVGLFKIKESVKAFGLGLLGVKYGENLRKFRGLKAFWLT